MIALSGIAPRLVRRIERDTEASEPCIAGHPEAGSR